jgi:aryl-alcohol dehydrogenase-like predicted oxidoreductase
VDALRAALPKSSTLPESALRFAISHPAVSTVIPGMRHLSHVRSNLEAVGRGALSPAELAKLRTHRWDRVPAAWSL